MKRPDMRPYFKAKIDQYVNGMMSRSVARIPPGVALVSGQVTDKVIVVTMSDGTEWRWTGGQYANRKVNLCYAPLMPKPFKEAS